MNRRTPTAWPANLQTTSRKERKKEHEYHDTGAKQAPRAREGCCHLQQPPATKILQPKST
ncbi:MAG: hypothetical protein ACTSUE_15280 [Promethearchaeota archaeon]